MNFISVASLNFSQMIFSAWGTISYDIWHRIVLPDRLKLQNFSCVLSKKSTYSDQLSSIVQSYVATPSLHQTFQISSEAAYWHEFFWSSLRAVSNSFQAENKLLFLFSLGKYKVANWRTPGCSTHFKTQSYIGHNTLFSPQKCSGMP